MGESCDHYRTALRKLADECKFGTITPDEILQDCLVFGVRDAKVRERLLREANLTLAKTVIPVDLYKRAAQDPSLKRVTKSTGNIVAYGVPLYQLSEVSH